MINDIKKDMIEQLSYFKETNPKGYMLYDDVQEMVNGVLEKYESFNNIGYFEACKQLQAQKDKEDELILFLKIQFLEGQNRKKMYETYPPKYVYCHSSRQ